MAMVRALSTGKIAKQLTHTPPVRPISGVTRAAISASLRLAYLKLKIDEDTRAEIKGIPAREARRMPEMTEQMTQTHEQMKKIIKKAFKKIGFDGNLYIEFNLPDGKSLDAQVRRFVDENGEKSAYVQILSYPKEIKEEDARAFFNELFAVAGHEAVHARDNHQYQDVIPYAIFAHSPLSFFLKDTIRNTVSKATEFMADFDSARQLGTGNVMIESMDNDIGHEGSPRHPTFGSRKACLKFAVSLFGAKKEFSEVEEVLEERAAHKFSASQEK